MPEQQRGGDRAHAARDRGQRDPVDSGDGLVHVAREAAVGGGVGADVDDRGAGGDVPGADQGGVAHRGDQDVGLAGDRGEVSGARMADGDGRVSVEQQQGGRVADDHGAAHHHRVPAPQLDPVVVKQGEDGLGGGRGGGGGG